MNAPARNREVEILRRTTELDEDYGTVVETGWATVVTVWAEVEDMLPGRSESLIDSVNLERRPARVWMPFRDGIDASMRFKVKGRGPAEVDRLMRIVSGPAESRFRSRMMFVAEELSTEGHEP